MSSLATKKYYSIEQKLESISKEMDKLAQNKNLLVNKLAEKDQLEIHHFIQITQKFISAIDKVGELDIKIVRLYEESKIYASEKLIQLASLRDKYIALKKEFSVLEASFMQGIENLIIELAFPKR